MSRARIPVFADKEPLLDYIIGADESGTGAFAGPFTVCAYMSHIDHRPALREMKPRDSKQMTERARFNLRERLAEVVELANIVEVAGDYLEQRVAWRLGIIEAVDHCLKSIDHKKHNVAVMIDGAPDAPLVRRFYREWGLQVDFIAQGDQKVPEISAASIFAKCRRTELMAELHEQFPVYGWRNNDGYGTAAHLRAIEEHGICALHRRVRPLLRYFSTDAETQSRED